MKHPYCQKHRSYFCPCVRPLMYRDVAAAKMGWDAAQAVYEEKQAQKRQAPPKGR